MQQETENSENFMFVFNVHINIMSAIGPYGALTFIVPVYPLINVCTIIQIDIFWPAIDNQILHEKLFDAFILLLLEQ